MSEVRAVLFDLDGTFADTAADLAHALNRMREERGLAALPLAATRAHTSAGARGLLKVGFDMTPEDENYETMRERFLALYEDGICIHTRLFDGIEELLAAIEERGLRWGIVTNKAKRFTEPLLERLGIASRTACAVSGDTTPRLKPHPDSLLHAAGLLSLSPAQCLYVGDDLRDMQAARAAGMRAIAAAWGYLGENGDPSDWGADAVIAHPRDVLNTL